MFSLIKEIYLNNPSKTLVTLKAEGNSHPVLLCAVVKLEGWGSLQIRKLGLIPNPGSQTPPSAQCISVPREQSWESHVQTQVTEEDHQACCFPDTHRACSALILPLGIWNS